MFFTISSYKGSQEGFFKNEFPDFYSSFSTFSSMNLGVGSIKGSNFIAGFSDTQGQNEVKKSLFWANTPSTTKISSN